MRVSAALLRGNGGTLTIEQVDVNGPASGEVLVRVVASGICHTDITVLKHMPLPWPAVLGHEGAGVVEQVGADVTYVKAGDHVIMTAASCGDCVSCGQGEPAFCVHFAARNLSGGKRLDGTFTHHQQGAPIFAGFLGQSAFAEHVLVDQYSVVKVAKDLPLDILCLLGCGVQTGVGAVLNTLKARAQSSIAIFGVGAVGLSAVMAAKIAGCTEIIAIDTKPDRLSLARTMGATSTLDPRHGDVVSRIQRQGGVDYAIEATGLASVMEQAVEALAHRGQAALMGVVLGAKISLDPTLLQSKGLTVKGSMMAGPNATPRQFLPELVKYWQNGQLPIEKMITRYDFSNINVALQDAQTGNVIKPVIMMAPRGMS